MVDCGQRGEVGGVWAEALSLLSVHAPCHIRLLRRHGSPDALSAFGWADLIKKTEAQRP